MAFCFLISYFGIFEAPKSAILKVEESSFNNLYLKKLSLASGNFYIFEKFVIGEVHTGVHFNWDTANEVIEQVYTHFGSRNIKVSYISNRVNTYTTHAQDWIRFYKERNHLEAFAVVVYSKLGFMNVVFELIFAQTQLRKFNSLEDTVAWVEQLPTHTTP